MTTEQENEWFKSIGLDPSVVSENDKEAMKKSHSYAFYKLGCDWQEVNNQISIAAKDAIQKLQKMVFNHERSN